MPKVPLRREEHQVTLPAGANRGSAGFSDTFYLGLILMVSAISGYRAAPMDHWGLCSPCRHAHVAQRHSAATKQVEVSKWSNLRHWR